MTVGLFLMMLQQLAAINTVMYYSTILFLRMGFHETTAAWLTCACAATQGLGVFLTVAWRLADRLGRRRLVLASALLVAASLFGLALTFSLAPYVAIAFLFTYLVAFGLGLSPVPWAVNSEIYPMYARSAAMAQATFANWETNFLVSCTFISVLNAFGALATFLGYAVITLAGAAFIFVYLPETAGQQLEHVFADFKDATAPPGLQDRMLPLTAAQSAGAPAAPPSRTESRAAGLA